MPGKDARVPTNLTTFFVGTEPSSTIPAVQWDFPPLILVAIYALLIVNILTASKLYFDQFLSTLACLVRLLELLHICLFCVIKVPCLQFNDTSHH